MILQLKHFNIDLFFVEEFKLFNLENVTFTDDVYYGDIYDVYDGVDDPEEYKEDMHKFGAIERNNEVIIPANLTFEVKKGYSHAYFTIIKNGIDFEFYDIEEIEIDIELTKFGEQCEKAAKLLGKSIEEIREDIMTYSKCFDIKIEE